METKAQISLFHQLLFRYGIAEHKEAILSGYGVESTKELNAEQLNTAILSIKDLGRRKDELLKKKRSQALKLATETGIKEVEGWEHFNQWMIQYSKYHKSLKTYTSKELDDLITQLRAIREKR